jgi:hypothetical protein
VIFPDWVESFTHNSYWSAPLTALQVKLGVCVAIVPVGVSGAGAPGADSAIVHVNEVEAVAVPSDTVMLVVNEPAAVGMPVTTPVDALIESPVGRPDALKVNVLASGSVAVIESDSATPVLPDWAPGFVTTGGRFVLVTVQVNVLESDPPFADAVTTTV